MTSEYELIPANRKKGSKRPQGWVDMAPGMNTKRRTFTEGYLLQRMPRTNSIGMNQKYVEKVLNNPRTPEYNRRFILQFVYDHPEKFLPLSEQTEDPDFNDWAKKVNSGAKHGWIEWLRKNHCDYQSGRLRWIIQHLT